MKTYRINWIDVDGNAAGIGFDETIQTEKTRDEVFQDALHHGACSGIDMERYQPTVEKITRD